jgi:hypothetical protein
MTGLHVDMIDPRGENQKRGTITEAGEPVSRERHNCLVDGPGAVSKCRLTHPIAALVSSLDSPSSAHVLRLRIVGVDGTRTMEKSFGLRPGTPDNPPANVHCICGLELVRTINLGEAGCRRSLGMGHPSVDGPDWERVAKRHGR